MFDPHRTAAAFGRFLRGTATERADALTQIDPALIAPVLRLAAKDKSARVRALGAAYTPPPEPSGEDADTTTTQTVSLLLSALESDRNRAFALMATDNTRLTHVLHALPAAPADLRFESLLLHALDHPALRPHAAHTLGRLRLAALVDSLLPFVAPDPLADFYDLCRRNARHPSA